MNGNPPTRVKNAFIAVIIVFSDHSMNAEMGKHPLEQHVVQGRARGVVGHNDRRTHVKREDARWCEFNPQKRLKYDVTLPCFKRFEYLLRFERLVFVEA